MAVNQRLRALSEIAKLDIIANYPATFPLDISSMANIRSFPAAQRTMPAPIKFPLFAIQVALWSALQRIIRRRYDIVYTFQDASAVVGWLLGPRASCWVMDVLDDPAQSHGNASQRGQRLKSWVLYIYECITGFLLRRADILFTIGVCQMDPLPRMLIAHYGVDARKIIPLRQSVNVQAVRGSMRGIGAAHVATKPSACFIGYVSRLRGVHTLIDAGIILRDRGVDLDIVLVGHLKKRDEEWLREAQRALPNIRYTGVLPSADALREMGAATVGILPFPERRETAPVQAVTGIEYLALGKPIVATDLPGSNALIDHYINGILVPPGDAAAMADAVEVIVTDPRLARQMGKASRKKAELFDAAHTRKEVVRVLTGN